MFARTVSSVDIIQPRWRSCTRTSREDRWGRKSRKFKLVARGMGSPRYANNSPRGSRSCVCAITFLPGGTRGGEGGKSSRRGKNLQWVAQGLSLPNSQPCFGGSKGSARVTGKAGENGQHFWWNGRQLTLDKTVGSRVWWHTQGTSGRPASDLGWGSSSKTAPGSLSTGSPASRTPPHGDGSMYS